MALLTFTLGIAVGAGIMLLLRPKPEQPPQQTAEQLAHRQRLETIGLLTSSISHEFNNLLTPIMGYSMMALEKLEPESGAYDDILEVYAASSKAKELISRLSELSRKNSGDYFRILSPDELVHKTITVATPAKPENVQVQLSLNCVGQQLYGNELQLNQLLLNLVLNAFHAMENSGGILALQTRFDEVNITFEVRDTGCGIKKEDIPHLFDPFFTTKPGGKGTGLGLAIAAQVVEDHKGTIHVDSRAGQGTTFTVKLPRMGK